VAITAVGSAYKNAIGAGKTTLAVTPTAIGNCLVVGAWVGTAITTVSGGGCTDWTRLVGPFLGTGGVYLKDIWLGTISTTGASTITFSGTAGSFAGYLGQEFAGGVGGAGTVWALDVSGTRSNTASTSIAYPTLVPGGTLRLYVGVAANGSTTNTTVTSGYTLQALATGSFPMIWHPNVSTSQSPTSGQVSSTSQTIGVCITASAAPTYKPGQFMPFFM